MTYRPLLVATLITSTTLGCASPGGTPGPTGSGGTASGGSPGSGGSGGGSGGSAGADAAVDKTSGTGGAAGDAGAGDGAGGDSAMGDCKAALPTSLFCAPLGPMPMSIKGTGLFPSAPDLTKHPASMLEYVPDPPLWSDGMEKQRFLILPPGTKIDNSDRKQWKFPTGTVFVKTFFDDSGAGGTSRPIETRLIRAAKGATYEYFVYQWNATATDATLVVNDLDGDINMDIPVMITIKHSVGGQPFMVNGGQPFPHTLPSRDACGQCHDQNGMVAQTFIGFDELRLNSKMPATAAKTQLQTFADAGVFMMPLPTAPATITDATADGGRMLRIKRFAFGNCVHCHNGQGQVDLHPDVFIANTVSKPTEAQSVHPPAGWLRVVPGAPLRSVVYVQMQRTMLPPPVMMTRLRAMPPVGVADLAAEQTSLKDVFDWITALR